MPYVATDPRITDVFRKFNAGEFGIADEDRNYLGAVRELETSLGVEEIEAEQVGSLDEQGCLLLMRYYDRGERFCDGFQASAHKRGLLRALLRRMIDLEAAR